MQRNGLGVTALLAIAVAATALLAGCGGSSVHHERAYALLNGAPGYRAIEGVHARLEALAANDLLLHPQWRGCDLGSVASRRWRRMTFCYGPR